jgi:hypothetical protein
MIQATIISVMQKVDLQTGALTNLLELSLSDGYCMTVPVSEQDAEHMVRVAVSGGHVTQEPAVDACVEVAAIAGPVQRMQEDDVFVFGGDAPSTPQALVLAPPTAPTSNVRPLAFARVSTYENKKGDITPIRTVSMDEAGNPIIPNLPTDGALSPFGDGFDDEGVPSI